MTDGINHPRAVVSFSIISAARRTERHYSDPMQLNEQCVADRISRFSGDTSPVSAKPEIKRKSGKERERRQWPFASLIVLVVVFFAFPNESEFGSAIFLARRGYRLARLLPPSWELVPGAIVIYHQGHFHPAVTARGSDVSRPKPGEISRYREGREISRWGYTFVGWP